MSEDNEKRNNDQSTVIGNRLGKTVFNAPVSEAQLILLAADVGASLNKTDDGIELNLQDYKQFVISNEGRLKSYISPYPAKNVIYNYEPAGFRFDYTYHEAPQGGVICIESYITPDGGIVKNANHTFFPDGTTVTRLYNLSTGELEPPNDQPFRIVDQDGKEISAGK